MKKTTMILAIMFIFALIGHADSITLVVKEAPDVKRRDDIDDIDKYIADSVIEFNRQSTPLHIPDNPDGIATATVLATLTSGIIISVVSIMLYTKYISKKSSISPIHKGTTQSQHGKEKHNSTAFTYDDTDDDFDYPYEDIGDVTGI